MRVQVGQYWVYKGNEYRVVQCDTLSVKDPNDGNWYDAVAYQASKDTDVPPNTYIRRLDDFLAKFKRPDELGEDNA